MAKNNPKIHHITLPFSLSNLDQIHAGDLVYLSGIICSGRDQMHKRVIEFNKQNKKLPEKFKMVKNCAIYHMGPIIKDINDEHNPEGPMKYELISGGPTTSARMSPFQKDVCQILKIPFVIGKGGMPKVKWSEIPAIYLQFPGGTGALMSKFVKNIINVEWLDLGVPEACWFLAIEEFGPLVVVHDVHGVSIYS